MKRKRRHLTAEFKARIAFEALKEEKTIQQIAVDEDVAPAQISTWKKELQERMVELFERKNASNENAKRSEAQTARLERKVGQLVTRKGISRKKVRAAGDRSERKAMIETQHPKLSVRRQCELVGVNRNRLAPRRTKTTDEDHEIMKILGSTLHEMAIFRRTKT